MVELKENIYEPKILSLKLRVFLNESDVFFDDEKEEYIDINLRIKSSSPKKIFKYMNTLLDESVGFAEKSGFTMSEDSVNTKTMYITAISDKLEASVHSDDLMRIILNDAKYKGIDFIPFLTIEQRLMISRAFWEVNPILEESKKKFMELMENWRIEMEKILEEQRKKSLENQEVISQEQK